MVGARDELRVGKAGVEVVPPGRDADGQGVVVHEARRAAKGGLGHDGGGLVLRRLDAAAGCDGVVLEQGLGLGLAEAVVLLQESDGVLDARRVDGALLGVAAQEHGHAGHDGALVCRVQPVLARRLGPSRAVLDGRAEPDPLLLRHVLQPLGRGGRHARVLFRGSTVAADILGQSVVCPAGNGGAAIVAGLAGFHDGRAKVERIWRRRNHHVDDRGTGALSDESDLFWITAKGCHIVSSPFEG